MRMMVIVGLLAFSVRAAPASAQLGDIGGLCEAGCLCGSACVEVGGKIFDQLCGPDGACDRQCTATPFAPARATKRELFLVERRRDVVRRSPSAMLY